MDYNATEHHTRVFADYLITKEGEDTDPETNLEESTVGVNPDQQPDPEGRAAGTIDAPWGEGDVPKDSSKPQDAEHYSDAVLESIVQSRENMLKNLFASKKPASDAEQKLVGGQLVHGASGKYESRAPLLEKSSSDRTLAQLTQGILE